VSRSNLLEELSWTDISTVAIIGLGVIGRAWISVFARSGCRTRVYDVEPNEVEKALGWFAAELEQDVETGCLTKEEAAARTSLVTAESTLGAALGGAGYVQESGPERLDVKRALFAEIDRLAEPKAILASSTSTFDMTDIARDLPGAHRCVVAHPVNPPNVIPVVEVVPSTMTDLLIVEQARDFLRSVGQKPVVLKSYVKGFIMNRMQTALVCEAFRLVESGVADVEAIDTVISEGVGLRWALMGPFGVGNTNADGGAREYFTRYRDAFISTSNSLGFTPSFDPDLIDAVGTAMDQMVGVDRTSIRKWLRSYGAKNPLSEASGSTSNNFDVSGPATPFPSSRPDYTA